MVVYKCIFPCTKKFHSSRAISCHLARSARCQLRHTKQAEAALSLQRKKLRTRSAVSHHGSPAPAHASPRARSPSFLLHQFSGPELVQSPGSPHRQGVDAISDLTASEDVYPGAGQIIRLDKGNFEKLADAAPDAQNPHWPFSCFDEWEVASWLATSGLPQQKIDSFLKINCIKNYNFSFGSAVTLNSRIELLPSPLSWKYVMIIPETAMYPPLDPITLYWREPMDCIAKLLANPRLSKGMHFAPRQVYEDERKITRIYNEMSTGDWWWRAQDNLRDGATVIPVILASDKTHLTTMVGDKEAWPLYLSIGNISQELRNKTSENAFTLVAYLPIPTFGEPQELERVLRARIYHQAVEYVLKQVQQCGEVGTELPDSDGNVRICHTFLAAHIADLPEQQLIAIAPHNCSPVTRIVTENFGSSRRAAPRSGAYVSRMLKKAARHADPQTELRKYITRSRLLGLSGVDKPFWSTHLHADPSIFLSPDHLHQVHKFFRDHILKWIKHVVGRRELDYRLRVLQPVPGFKHWKNGISHLKQWTGREDREIQRTILAVAVGGGKMTPLAVQNLRAALDFIYLSQYTSHSEETLKYLTKALAKFHKTKNEWIRLGGRRGKRGVLRHFKIPKLPSWLNFAPSVREIGASLQFTADTPERRHIDDVKQPHAKSNKKDPTAQMCRSLDRLEKVDYRNAYLDWSSTVDADVENDKDEDVLIELRNDVCPRLDPQEVQAHHQPMRLCISIRLAIRPKLINCPLDRIGALYELDDFRTQIEKFYSQSPPPFTKADVWLQFRLQLSTVQEPKHALPTRTVQAWPPTEQMPFGRCHAVLVPNRVEGHERDESIQAFSVAQIRCIFRPKGETASNALAYVQWFTNPPATPEKNIDMYVVSRLRKGKKPVGGVIPLASVMRMIQLVPKFGKHKFDCNNILDIGDHYYINSFWDKEVYQAVY